MFLSIHLFVQNHKKTKTEKRPQKTDSIKQLTCYISLIRWHMIYIFFQIFERRLVFSITTYSFFDVSFTVFLQRKTFPALSELPGRSIKVYKKYFWNTFGIFRFFKCSKFMYYTDIFLYCPWYWQAEAFFFHFVFT